MNIYVYLLISACFLLRLGLVVMLVLVSSMVDARAAPRGKGLPLMGLFPSLVSVKVRAGVGSDGFAGTGSAMAVLLCCPISKTDAEKQEQQRLCSY